MLRLDKVFQKIAGLDYYPTQSTISRFLKGFQVETAKGIAKSQSVPVKQLYIPTLFKIQ